MSLEPKGDRKAYALDKYPIGSGGFADVYAAKHKPTGSRVAFKKLRHGVRHAVERFKREIAVMQTISHSNVMPLLDADRGGQWYTMPLADDSLTNLIRVLDEVALEECFRQVGAGLANAHQAGLVHRDVSPNNILRIRDAGGVRWVVADWGLVRRPPGETGDFVTKGALGTEGFAAPEAWIAGHDVDQRADIYSLGRVIAWAVTRNPPIPNIDLPAPGRWRTLVAKMTAHEPTGRHNDLGEVIADIKALGGPSPIGQLIALGPELIAEGDLVEVGGRDWSIVVDRFIVGHEAELLRFSEGFADLGAHDRYVTLERGGESRVVASAPRMKKKGGSWEVRLEVGDRYERLHVDSLHDELSLEDFSTIVGREQLPQIFLSALSTERGELPGSPDWGTHVRRRFQELGDTPLFERVLLLEAMRQASIPFVEDGGTSATPLRCVERVRSIELSPGRDSDYRSVRVVADVHGIGQWEGVFELLVTAPRERIRETEDIELGAVRPPSRPISTSLERSEDKPSTPGAVPVPQSSPPRTSLPVEAAPPLFPTLGVFRPTVGSRSDLIAEQFFRLRIYSPAFERASFEPKEEDAFLARVRQVFIEDANAELEPPDAGRMVVQHAGFGRSFHRRWGWWTKGVVGMAATLTDLNRPGRYSVADVAVDVMRFISLASDVGGGIRATADLVLELDPHPLTPEFDLSDKRARAHLPVAARLGGVGTVAHAEPTSTKGRAVAATYRIDTLKSDAVDFTANALVLLMRSFHRARIDTERFSASIPEVIAASIRARTR